MLFGWQDMRALLPLSVFVQVSTVFVYIYFPLTQFETGKTEISWLDLPGTGFYLVQALLITLFLWRRRGLTLALAYALLVILLGLARTLHTRYIFQEYVKSESDKILVILIYQPAVAVILLAACRVITVRIIDMTPGADPADSRWYYVYGAIHLAVQITGRYEPRSCTSCSRLCFTFSHLEPVLCSMYLFNVSSLPIQVATSILSGVFENSLRITRVVRTRKLWSLVTNPKFAAAQAKLLLSHPYNLHVQYLSQLLEIASIFIAFGTALLVRARYDLKLPLDVVIASFVVQLCLELFFDSVTLLFESSIMGFTARARLYVEHQEKFYYFRCGLVGMIMVPLMSGVWVSCIAILK